MSATPEHQKQLAEALTTAAQVIEDAAKGRGNPILMRRTAEELKAPLAELSAVLDAQALANAVQVLEDAAKGRGNPILMRRTAEDLKSQITQLSEVINAN
jgi:uncharacterized protein (UPF0147 family)